jgi:hypothetical protein
MAPLPTIGNCVRVALNWSSSGGIKPVNVFHLITSSTNETAIGEALDDAFVTATSEAWAFTHSSYECESYTITLLDGSSAGQVIPTGTPFSGGGTGGLVPQVAAVLSLRTIQRGARGRGRLYMGPVGETDIDAGLLDSNKVDDVLAAWDQVEASLASNSMSLGVASYVHADVHGVSSISMRSQAGTQRRRQDQLV